MITNTAQLKAAVGGAVNTSFSFSSVAHEVPTIIEDHIKPLFGEDLYTLIDAAVASSVLAEVRNYCVNALGYLLMSEYAEVGAVQVTNHGIVRSESDAVKTAYKYQEQRYRQAVRVKGHDALERALYFLHAHIDELNVPELDAWTNSPAEYQCRGGLVCFRKVVEHYHGVNTDRVTFTTLRPILESYERTAVKGMLGTATYDLLVGRIRTGDVAAVPMHFGNDEWDHLANLLRSALVLAAVAEAQRRFLVTVQGGRVVLNQESSQDVDRPTAVPGANLIGISHEHLHDFKNTALLDARAFLEDNPDTFTVYAAEHADDDDDNDTGVVNHGAIVSF